HPRIARAIKSYGSVSAGVSYAVVYFHAAPGRVAAVAAGADIIGHHQRTGGGVAVANPRIPHGIKRNRCVLSGIGHQIVNFHTCPIAMSTTRARTRYRRLAKLSLAPNSVVFVIKQTEFSVGRYRAAGVG